MYAVHFAWPREMKPEGALIITGDSGTTPNCTIPYITSQLRAVNMLLLFMKTKSMEQDLVVKLLVAQLSKQFSSLWNKKSRCCVYKNPLEVPVVSHMNPVNILGPFFL